MLFIYMLFSLLLNLVFVSGTHAPVCTIKNISIVETYDYLMDHTGTLPANYSTFHKPTNFTDFGYTDLIRYHPSEHIQNKNFTYISDFFRPIAEEYYIETIHVAIPRYPPTHFEQFSELVSDRLNRAVITQYIALSSALFATLWFTYCKTHKEKRSHSIRLFTNIFTSICKAIKRICSVISAIDACLLSLCGQEEVNEPEASRVCSTISDLRDEYQLYMESIYYRHLLAESDNFLQEDLQRYYYHDFNYISCDHESFIDSDDLPIESTRTDICLSDSEMECDISDISLEQSEHLECEYNSSLSSIDLCQDPFGNEFSSTNGDRQMSDNYKDLSLSDILPTNKNSQIAFVNVDNNKSAPDTSSHSTGCLDCENIVSASSGTISLLQDVIGNNDQSIEDDPSTSSFYDDKEELFMDSNVSGICVLTYKEECECLRNEFGCDLSVTIEYNQSSEEEYDNEECETIKSGTNFFTFDQECEVINPLPDVVDNHTQNNSIISLKKDISCGLLQTPVIVSNDSSDTNSSSYANQIPNTTKCLEISRFSTKAFNLNYNKNKESIFKPIKQTIPEFRNLDMPIEIELIERSTPLQGYISEVCAPFFTEHLDFATLCQFSFRNRQFIPTDMESSLWVLSTIYYMVVKGLEEQKDLSKVLGPKGREFVAKNVSSVLSCMSDKAIEHKLLNLSSFYKLNSIISKKELYETKACIPYLESMFVAYKDITTLTKALNVPPVKKSLRERLNVRIQNHKAKKLAKRTRRLNLKK